MTSTYSTDIVIFGGGIAGLWLLNRLRNDGYQAILFETNTLGGGQTIASQGIVHGGLKYALSGSLTGAAKAIAAMPEYWKSCLQGKGNVDISGCEILSDHYYMWSNAGFRSKMYSFLGSKSLRGRVETVSAENYPPFFRQATVDGSLYKLPDFVVNTKSLLSRLSSNQRKHIFKVDPEAVNFSRDETGAVKSIAITNEEQDIMIKAQRIVFCAGEGNQDLILRAKLQKAKTQIRPLKMVYVTKKDLPPVYVHCIGSNFSLTPKLTITSHTDADGEVVWYLGGELAEAGVKQSDTQLVESAQELISELFPWIDLGDAQWHCVSVNRAEANVSNNHRPDDAFIIEEDNIICAWPTKLTLAPSLADKVINHLQAVAVLSKSTHKEQDDTMISGLAEMLSQPTIADAHWD